MGLLEQIKDLKDKTESLERGFLENKIILDRFTNEFKIGKVSLDKNNIALRSRSRGKSNLNYGKMIFFQYGRYFSISTDMKISTKGLGTLSPGDYHMLEVDIKIPFDVIESSINCAIIIDEERSRHGISCLRTSKNLLTYSFSYAPQTTLQNISIFTTGY